MNNHPNNRQERVFKIFTPVRCMNRDQLPRYVQGNMTEVEKHLVEQHLVDCDLCCAAVLALQDLRHHEPFERYSTELSNFLHREYAPPPKVQKKQHRTQQYARAKDGLLSSFWVVMFIVIGGGSVFLLQQHLKNRPALMILPAKAADAVALQTPAVHMDSNYHEEPAGKPGISRAPVAAVVHKDTVRKAVPPRTDSAAAAKKVKDTIKHKPPTDTAARTVAKTPPPAPKTPDTAQKEPPKVAATEEKPKEPAPEPAEEKEKEKETPKPSTPTVSGDESLFRAAMQYQQQGNINEAIDQFRKLSSNYKYSERAKYQLALCYRVKGQNGKARRLLKEIVKMEGNMKDKAQAQLDNMN